MTRQAKSSAKKTDVLNCSRISAGLRVETDELRTLSRDGRAESAGAAAQPQWTGLIQFSHMNDEMDGLPDVLL